MKYVSPDFPGMKVLCCNNSFSFERHIHDGYVVWLNDAGGEHYTVAGNEQVLRPGSISVIEPGVVHANRPSSHGGRQLRSLYLDTSFFAYLERALDCSVGQGLDLQMGEYSDTALWQRFIMLHMRLVQNKVNMETEQLLLEVFSELFSHSGSVAEQSGIQAIDSRLRKILEYMNGNYHEQITLSDLAQLVDCSQYYLIRMFSLQVGISPHKYLVQLRLEKAREKLDKGMSIADAALLTAFSDQSHLTRKFKQRYGLTPGKYLAQQSC